MENAVLVFVVGKMKLEGFEVCVKIGFPARQHDVFNGQGIAFCTILKFLVFLLCVFLFF